MGKVHAIVAALKIVMVLRYGLGGTKLQRLLTRIKSFKLKAVNGTSYQVTYTNIISLSLVITFPQTHLHLNF